MEFTTKIKENLFVIMITIFYLLLFSCIKGNDARASVAEEMYTVDYYLPGDEQGDFPNWMVELNKDIEENVNASLNMIHINWGNYENKLTTMVTAGEKIDIALTFSDILPYKAFMNKGSFADLSELLPEVAPKLYNLYTPEQWEAVRINGEIGAVPVYNGFNIGFRFHKQEVDRYGLQNKIQGINNLDSLESVLQDYVEISGHPGFANQARWFLGAGYYTSVVTDRRAPWVVKADDETMTVINLYEQSDYIYNMEKVREWSKKGWVYTPDHIEAFDGIGTGKEPDWLVQPQVHKPDVPSNEYLPNARDGGFINFYSTASDYPLVLQPDFYHSVMSHSDDVVKSLKVMQYLFTNKATLAMLQWGLLGSSWTAAGGFAKLADTPSVTRHQWEFKIWGNVANTLRFGSPDDLIKQEADAINDAIIPSVAQFSPDTRSIRTELAAISNITLEYRDQILSGVRNIAEVLSEMQDRMNAAGYEKVRTGLQRQIDVWKDEK